MHLCGRIQWNIRWLQVSEGKRTGITYSFFFLGFFFCVFFFILVAVLLKLETITQFYFSSDSYHSCWLWNGTFVTRGLWFTTKWSARKREWPSPMPTPGWRVRMLTFCFFLSYGVVRNASNKYWWHFSLARIEIYEPQEIDLEAATNQCDSERVVWGSLKMNAPFQSTCLIYGPLQDFKEVQ